MIKPIFISALKPTFCNVSANVWMRNSPKYCNGIDLRTMMIVKDKVLECFDQVLIQTLAETLQNVGSRALTKTIFAFLLFTILVNVVTPTLWDVSANVWMSN